MKTKKKKHNCRMCLYMWKNEMCVYVLEELFILFFFSFYFKMKKRKKNVFFLENCFVILSASLLDATLMLHIFDWFVGSYGRGFVCFFLCKTYYCSMNFCYFIVKSLCFKLEARKLHLNYIDTTLTLH